MKFGWEWMCFGEYMSVYRVRVPWERSWMVLGRRKNGGRRKIVGLLGKIKLPDHHAVSILLICVSILNSNLGFRFWSSIDTNDVNIDTE